MHFAHCNKVVRSQTHRRNFTAVGGVASVAPSDAAVAGSISSLLDSTVTPTSPTSPVSNSMSMKDNDGGCIVLTWFVNNSRGSGSLRLPLRRIVARNSCLNGVRT